MGKDIIRQPAGMFADFGYTGGQSLTRKNNSDGISHPNIKQGMSNLSSLFKIRTSVIDEMNPLFLDRKLAWMEITNK